MPPKVSEQRVVKLELGDFVVRLKECIADRIVSAEEALDLYALADTSNNPSVRFFFTQFLTGGASVTRYTNATIGPGHGYFDSKPAHMYTARDPYFKDQNLCLNFSGDSLKLPCIEPDLVDGIFGYNALASVDVPSMGALVFTDPAVKARLQRDALQNWDVNSKDISITNAFNIIRDYTGDVIMVRSILERVFKQIYTPAAASAVMALTLSIFSTSPNIITTERGAYARMAYASACNWRERYSRMTIAYNLTQEPQVNQADVMSDEGFVVEAKREWVDVPIKPSIAYPDIPSDSQALLRALENEKNEILDAWQSHIEATRAHPDTEREIPRLQLEYQALIRAYEKYQTPQNDKMVFSWTYLKRTFSQKEYTVEALTGTLQWMLTAFTKDDSELAAILDKDLNFVRALASGDPDAVSVALYMGGGFFGPWVVEQGLPTVLRVAHWLASTFIPFLSAPVPATATSITGLRASILAAEAEIALLEGGTAVAAGRFAGLLNFASKFARFNLYAAVVMTTYSTHDFYDSATDRFGVSLSLPAWTAAPAAFMEKRYQLTEDLPSAEEFKDR
ncbi:MAG: hypothetical protein HQM16_01270 [Deltaproteobacteria bacterium]|nr:hypothetical protein [Deltaproteobacteria bacterium]